MKKQNYKVLGVMSGTSLDGIDLAVCEFTPPENSSTGTWEYAIGRAETQPYQPHWKQKLQQAIRLDSDALDVLNEEYTELLSEYINVFIAKHNIENLDAVCSHGHTVLHQPQNGITLQIGNLPKISDLLQQKVVCNFRVQDVAMGGQGAPLVPIGDQLLFSEYDYCLNLGGFANVSLNQNGRRLAYDICPVNIVLNNYAEQAGVPYDDEGKLAKSGTVLLAKSALLQNLSYYKERPPKSLGLEWVLKNIFPILDASYATPTDTLRTFTDHAALQIAKQFNKGSRVLVTGGGAYNTYLLNKIKMHKDVDLVVPSTQLLEFKEALVFGFLGVLKLRNEINCLASVTGAKQDHSSGVIYDCQK